MKISYLSGGEQVILKIYSQNVWNVGPSEHRLNLIKKLIFEFDADICLFQEFSPKHIRNIKQSLPSLINEKYIEVCNEKSEVNFTPVFYKKDKFSLVDCGYFQYEGLNDAGSKSVTWAVLSDKEDKLTFAVLSTHFWWMFETEQDNKQRIQNADDLKFFCDNLLEKYNCSIIIGGDFNNGVNSLQGEEPYKHMLNIGFTDVRYTASSSCDIFTHRDCSPDYSGNDILATMPTMRNLDYIFTYGKNEIFCEKFDVLTSNEALISSDHCPLIAEFKFKKRKDFKNGYYKN